MLQLLGWLGCLYLLVKGLAMIGDLTLVDGDGERHPATNIAIMLAIAGAVVFAIFFAVQGNAMPDLGLAASSQPAPMDGDYAACLEQATTIEQMSACQP